jgi:hypothetical protein
MDGKVSVNQQAVVLPVNVLSRESSQLGYSQAGIKQRPDNEALLVCLTR